MNTLKDIGSVHNGMMDKKKNLKNGKRMLDFDDTNLENSNKDQSEELNLYDVLKGNKELKLSSEEIKKREAQLKNLSLEERKEKIRKWFNIKH